MSGMMGGDLAQGRGSTRRRCGRGLGSTQWTGPAADRFRNEWIGLVTGGHNTLSEGHGAAAAHAALYVGPAGHWTAEIRRRESLPPGRGYLVADGVAELIQAAQP